MCSRRTTVKGDPVLGFHNLHKLSPRRPPCPVVGFDDDELFTGVVQLPREGEQLKQHQLRRRTRFPHHDRLLQVNRLRQSAVTERILWCHGTKFF